ncbi:hypothetical protein VR46_21955, partial [Streptomyces sp. NRRL S-444]
RTVEFWDLATGCEVGTEYVLPLPVGALAAAPGGALVLAYGPQTAVLSRRTTHPGHPARALGEENPPPRARRDPKETA